MASAQTQPYPAKPIRLIVPFAPGGGTDIIARLIGTDLTESMGQPVVIDNRGGSGGVVGINLMAKADPDGHTIGLCSLGFSYAPAVYARLPYDTEKDLAPIAQVASQPFVFTHPFVQVLVSHVPLEYQQFLEVSHLPKYLLRHLGQLPMNELGHQLLLL